MIAMKGKIAMDSGTPYLSQEITTNILKRLPAKSLIRFQCVCKDWKSLFKTPSFIKEHLHHSTHKNPCILFLCDNPPHGCLINRDMQLLQYQTPPLKNSSMCRFFPSSSNGLVLLQLSKSKSFCVWNPATREVHHVARPLSLGRGGISSIGFGFSPTFNDYKIVRIFSSISDCAHSKVEVFSLSTRSWKKVEVGKLIDVISTIHFDGLTLDGAIFWLCYGNELIVLSFDISTDVFKLISCPSAARESKYSLLTIYENKLAMLSQNYFANIESYSIDLWVMDKCVDELGEKSIWTKIYTSNIYPNIIHPVTMWGNEIVCKVYKMDRSIWRQKALLGDDEAILVFCNLRTNEFKEFGKFSFSGTIWNHIESIISDPAEMVLGQDEIGCSTQEYGPVAPRRSLRLKKRPRNLLDLDEVLI